MFAIVESAGDRNVLLCYSSKKYPPGTASRQGSLIGGSSRRRILYSCRTQVARHGTFPSPLATALMESFSLFINKDDTNASAPVAMTRAYTLSFACMMASAAAARTSGRSLRKIALYGPAMAVNLLD